MPVKNIIPGQRVTKEKLQRAKELRREMGLWVVRGGGEDQGDGRICSMKIIYDQVADILTIIFTEAPVAESDEDKPGVILDYDDKGNLVSLEILDASRRVNVPSKIEYQVSPVV